MVEKGKQPTSRPLPLALVGFLELYEEGRFWDSHEILEGPWREQGSAFYQALILYASAFVHHGDRNAHGVRAQLGKALDRLEGYPSAYLGLDVDALRAHCREVRATVEAHPDDWYELVSPLPIAVAAERVRGDEPELGYAARPHEAEEEDGPGSDG